MSAKLFVVLALGAAVGWLATGPPKDIVAADRSRLSCQDCLAIAGAVATKLSRAAGKDDDSPSGPGRRIRLPNSEAAVGEALDNACAAVGADTRADCTGRMEAHRGALEDYLLNKGAALFDAALCVEALRLCAPHEVQGGGEL